MKLHNTTSVKQPPVIPYLQLHQLTPLAKLEHTHTHTHTQEIFKLLKTRFRQYTLFYSLYFLWHISAQIKI
jgi:hypothetical protein